MAELASMAELLADQAGRARACQWVNTVRGGHGRSICLKEKDTGDK